jgi:signal transduction histidine kinase
VARRVAWVIAFWTIPGLVSTTQIYWLWNTYEAPLGFHLAALWQMPPWYFWAAATPLIVLIARRFRLERRGLATAVFAHVVANVVLGAMHLSVAVGTARLAVGGWYDVTPFSEILWKMFTKNVHLELLTYWGVVAVAHALEYYRQARERTLVTAQLEARLAQAQLEALKMQLHPHFLFNTLHAIGVLVRKADTAGSLRMLTGLSDLLRLTLDSVGRQLVPLKQELDFVDRYLAIEKVRFQDSLRVETHVAPETLDAPVPSFLLQPIVENAIRHGIGGRAGPGTVEIAARRADDRLIMTVRDDGAGLAPGWRPGVGLGNVRARLAQLYGAAHRLELERDPRGGTLVTVEVPWQSVA